ncbi:MAG: FAD-dependent oxidoreductase [Acidobacteriota bacterium]|nr:FAD-dependent oxidoreductase [Acidobacteriota bacterium]
MLNSPVTNITYGTDTVSVTANGKTLPYDYVVLTPQIWASQLGIAFEGFSPGDLPDETVAARNEQHLIASCKVFFPLSKPYWGPGATIPQLIVTDTFVQDAYGVQWSNDDPGVLLASYTWEDDALKLLPYSNDQVAAMVLDQLDAITASTLNGAKISDYVLDRNDAVVFQWTTQVGYNGCAKLYRQRNWSMNYALLAYNQQYSKSSRLYLAGETFGVEGGWTEPALRLALDAVIRIIQNSGGTFANGFNVDTDYPTYDTTFTPDENYCST